MAEAKSLAELRRALAQRLNYWGGDIQTNGPGVFSANGTANSAIDLTRVEPDDEWNEAWIVVNPGSTDQAGSPTVWRRIAVDAGWVQSTGTFTIQGTWPASYAAGPLSGTSYEVFKVFRPENWLQAINWALIRAYPNRHFSVSFELPQDNASKIINWGNLVKNMSTSNPAVAPVVTEIADGQGLYQPGLYTFAYTYYNDLGETKISPTFNLNIVGINSSVQFAAITGVPAVVSGVKYYSSVYPADTQLGQLITGSGSMTDASVPNTFVGENLDGRVRQIVFQNPHSGYGAFPPIYNTTNVDVQQLHHVLQRVNPGQYPEAWIDLGSDLYKPLGGRSIMLMFLPVKGQNLRFMCSATVPLLDSEIAVSDEPPEMIYAGAEAYLWNLLVRTSTLVNTNWKDLAKQALIDYELLKDDYTLDLPRDIAYRPLIRITY